MRPGVRSLTRGFALAVLLWSFWYLVFSVAGNAFRILREVGLVAPCILAAPPPVIADGQVVDWF
jgi:hypothetical protein